MNITERNVNGVTVFVLDGRIDTEGAVELDRTLQSAVAAGKVKMVLDLSGIAYISSAGLRTLADIVTRNREQDGDLKLATVNPKVLRVLRIIGFDRFFTCFDTQEEAVADFTGPA